jgi:hypothetical protein
MLMMGSVFTCWCFRVRVLVLGGGSLAFSLINGINLWRQVSSFRNSTLDDQRTCQYVKRQTSGR